MRMLSFFNKNSKKLCYDMLDYYEVFLEGTSVSIRSNFAITVGKTTRWGLHTFFKGGSSLPGVITKKLDPTVLGALAKDFEVVIVTGTNGCIWCKSCAIRHHPVNRINFSKAIHLITKNIRKENRLWFNVFGYMN